MSSIERAIDKLAGDEPAEDEPRTTETGETDEPVLPAEAAELTSVVPPVPPTPLTTPEADIAAVQVPPVAPIATPMSRLADGMLDDQATAPGTIGPEPIRPPETWEADSNFVRLDLERLGAGGFLCPGQAVTRQSEEYQQIKRRLLGNLAPGMLPNDRLANLIMVTSSVPGEGKTFTSVNLGISLSMEHDHRTLLIDTDLVKTDLGKTFGINKRAGLYDYLADDTLSLGDVIIRTNVPNLTLIPAGNHRERSTELLASKRMHDLTRELASRYSDRVVIFDSPPVLATTAASALAPYVGQLLLIVEAGRTKQESVKESLRMLEGTNVTGLVLNKSRQPAQRGYDYYGYYTPSK